MLFAIKYRPRPGRSEAESHRVRNLLMKWEAPEDVAVKHHFHYISGGGVLIVETDDSAALYQGIGPFKSLVSFDVEPVINFVEAMAISADVEEWAASAQLEPADKKAAA